jgi:hypothetical protein
MTPSALALVTTDPVDELKTQALTWPDRAHAALVVDQPTYITTGELLKGIKALSNQIDEHCDPNIARWHAGHKAAVAEKTTLKAPLTEAEGIIKRTLIAWTTEQERLRREEQRRLEELARKEEEERRLAEALAAEAAGDLDAASAIVEEAVVAPPPAVIVQSTVPKVAGISFRENWTFRIIEARLIPREYLMPDEVKIRGVVRAMKG